MTGPLLLLLAASAHLIHAHTVITYPGWRGNNLVANATFPFGMQWMYPCGGTTPTENRTKWPLDGSGALAFQPGWFQGHARNLVYVNLGLGAQPANYSMPMVPMFEIQGPSNNPYPGTFCLPRVPLPKGVTVKKGDLASIQIIETQAHGGALYNCADIIFTDDLTEVPPVTADNCFNSSSITVGGVRIVSDTPGGGSSTSTSPSSVNNPDPQPPASTSPLTARAASTVSKLPGVSALLVFLHLL